MRFGGHERFLAAILWGEDDVRVRALPALEHDADKQPLAIGAIRLDLVRQWFATFETGGPALRHAVKRLGKAFVGAVWTLVHHVPGVCAVIASGKASHARKDRADQ